MAKQLSTRAIGKRTLVGQLEDFPDVVEKRSREHEIAIDLRIIAADQVARVEQRDHMIEKPADVGVMQSLGRWCVAVGLGNLGVAHECLNQRLKMRILKRLYKRCKRSPQLVDVFRSLWEVIRKINFRIAHLAQLVDGELKTVLVLVEQAFGLDEVVLLEYVDRVFDVIPHLGFELAAAIAEHERKIRLSCLLGLDLLGDHHEGGSNHLILVLAAIGDKEILHSGRSGTGRGTQDSRLGSCSA